MWYFGTETSWEKKKKTGHNKDEKWSFLFQRDDQWVKFNKGILKEYAHIYKQFFWLSKIVHYVNSVASFEHFTYLC